MNRTTRLIGLTLVLSCTWPVAVWAAEISDAMPAGTILYVSWPGADALGEASKDTAWGKLMAEPETVRFRQRWSQEIWPAIDRLIRDQAGGGPQAECYEPAINVLSAAWKYPTALGLAGVDMAPAGPQIDVALVIRAGADAQKLAENVDTIVKIAMGATGETREFKVGAASLREITLPEINLPLRYGVIGQDLVIAIGTKFAEYWAAGAAAKPLTTSERFAAAMKTTGGSTTTPVAFLDIRGVIETLEKFQPLLAAQNVPILSEPGGVQKLLDGVGLGTMQSFSVAIKPEAGGFVTRWYLHAPNLGEGAAALFAQKPLTDNDLKCVPSDVTFATVINYDFAAAYRTILAMAATVAPDIHAEIMPKIEDFETRIGVKIEQDLLGSFGDTWAIYDSPANGGFWFTGIVAVAELKPGNKLDESLDKIVKAVAGLAGEQYPITIHEDSYRNLKIRFVNVGNLPVPLAPAWAIVGDRCVLGLYPQMVRTAADHLIDNGPTLLDNPDFQHGRKQMPAEFSSISYTDTVGGIRLIYSIAIPASAALTNWLQGQKIPLDASLLPSSRTATKHLFGNVGARAATKDGLLYVSYGALPISIPSIGAGGAVAAPMAVAILLPALSRARELAKRTASMSNLRQISMACLMYSNDHDGKFPPSLATLTEGDPPLLDKRLLKSPRDDSAAEVSYIYVTDLPQNPTRPGEMILAYENPDLPSSSEGLCVAFIDGHVEWLTKEAFEKRLAEKQKPGETPSP